MPQLCVGARDGAPCCFGPSRGRAQTKDSGGRCVFCDPKKLGDALLCNKTRKPVMFKFKKLDEDLRSIVIERAPGDAKKAFTAAGERHRFCEGRPGESCVFSDKGDRCRVRGNRLKCFFCGSVEDMVALLQSPNGQKLMAARLRRMTHGARETALGERIPAAHRDAIRAKLPAAATARGARKRRRVDALPLTDQNGKQAWAPTLQRRGVTWGWTPFEQREFRKRMLDDKGIAARRFGIKRARVRRGEAVCNEAPVPDAQLYPLARKFQLWAKYNSWRVCSVCGVKQPRALSVDGMTQILPPEIPANRAKVECVNCKAARPYSTPWPAGHPKVLQGLDVAAASALALVEVDAGPFRRAQNGYRVHSAMMRFRWAPTSAEKRVGALTDRRVRKQAKRALDYLLSDEGANVSCWRWYYDEHVAFLEKHGEDADQRVRARWSRFIEAEGVECAAWPTVFYDRSLCLTVERAYNPGRSGVGRQSWENYADGQPDVFDELDAMGDGEGLPGPAIGDGRHSIKRYYMALAMAADLSFGAMYEVLHFMYDLHLWTVIGAKRHVHCGASLRQMLAGESFSPLFWRRAHLSLLDIVRQRGCPPLFLTVAPYEWSIPYHVSVLDEMEKIAEPRQGYAVHETLHMTHVMTQAVWGLLCGANKGASPIAGASANDYQIIPAIDDNGEKVDVYPVLRIEFQDGTHKDPTQDYHGSGRPHLHAVVFGLDPKKWKLHRWARADIPGEDEGAMRNFVLGSQINKPNKKGVRETEWPAFEESSRWNDETSTYELFHPEGHKSQGVRAYVAALMEGLSGCHQDSFAG